MKSPAPAVMSFDVPPEPAVEAAVRTAIDDYFGGWFAGDAERMRRALHPDLAKKGVYPEAGAWPRLTPRTASDMVELTAAGGGSDHPPMEKAYEVRIIEVHDAIATAIVHSLPYIEYLHLVRTPDGWRVIHAVWQFPEGAGQ